MLITDVGNDILYGATPAEIARSLEVCLERLANNSSKTVITELPLESLKKVGPRRYLLMRSILFPKSRLAHGEAMARAHELNERVRQLSDRHRACLVKPDAKWYGFDPIHIRYAHQQAAWRALLAPLRQADALWHGNESWRESCALRLLRPQRRRLFGIQQTQPQPAGILKDGTLVSLY